MLWFCNPFSVVSNNTVVPSKLYNITCILLFDNFFTNIYDADVQNSDVAPVVFVNDTPDPYDVVVLVLNVTPNVPIP